MVLRIVRALAVALFFGAVSSRLAAASPLPPVVVSADGHSLQTKDGRPFFWLGDTAWQLIHDTTPDECAFYLKTRAGQGFTVIQTVVLTEFDGLNHPDELGDRPLFGNDPSRPNPRYFQHVVDVVDAAAKEGLYVALVPVWGDKLTAPWGSGPRLFTTENLPVAREFGRYVGALLRDRSNVIWLLGGDRPARLHGLKNSYLLNLAKEAGFSPDADWTPIWRALADGIADGTQGHPLIVFHPQGGEESSSVFLHDEPWLSVNGMQSGHGGGHDVPVWQWIARDYARQPTKPTLDLEPNYEDCPYNPWPRWDPANGYFRDYDVRKQTYRSVFAGGCGVTYGHHSVWQFACARREPLLFVEQDWTNGLWRPGGRQMQFLRALVLSRPWLTRRPDQRLIVGDAGDGGRHLQAVTDEAGSYAFVYFPCNDQEATIDLGRVHATRIAASWYDPRTGAAHPAGEFTAGQPRAFRSPPMGPDWVLVLDDVAQHYPAPGLTACGR